MIRILLSFIGSICLALLYNVNKKNLLCAGIAGTLGIIASDQILYFYPDAALVSVLSGTAAVAVYSEIMARIRKTPSTIFSIPGIFPLVPGVDAYRTIQFISSNDYSSAISFGISTVVKASLIAFGILMITAIFRKIKLQQIGKANT